MGVAFKPGDPVWYRQEMRGGYGFIDDVPAEYVRETAHRITVRVRLVEGGTREIHVKRDNVRARDLNRKEPRS